MISAIMLLNHKGDVVIYRVYRDDVRRTSADDFCRLVVAKKEANNQPPISVIGGSSFLYTRHHGIYFIAISNSNVNPALVFQYLYQLIRIFGAYFGKKWDESAIRDNFTLVYELLDETLDFGYPQNSSIDVLRLYINLGTVQRLPDQDPTKLTSQITGAIDWRSAGLKYRKNEVFIDVLESVNMLLSTDGNVLRNDVTGQVMMKAFLTGMPECKFGLNDKLLLDKEKHSGSSKTGRSRRATSGVEIDDCTFHRCVRLGKFDADRTITFIPPDGEFELMRFRITENVNLPFRLIPVIEERGKTRVAFNIKAIANFSSKLFATNVVIKVPCPPTTARAKVKVSGGRAKYEPIHNAIVWRTRRFGGGAEYTFVGEAELISSTRGKKWSRPPIEMEFQVPMFTASGLHVRFLKVFEKSNYPTTKWVRYITRAGQYQIRV